jgi:UDP-N-acetylmuramoyl-tripeptide--D-alanyl-D-alanine ligase
MRLTLRELLSLADVEVRNEHRLKGAVFTGVSTDSRSVRKGDLFFALRGGRFDGHEFVSQAIARGARGVVVDRKADTGRYGEVPLIIVPDTVQTLGEVARLYRRRFRIPVVAIAGSNGKTTTKEMVAAVLRTTYRVLSTEGNLNNQIGVPLTLFRLDGRHRVAVVEIGTNHPGEIAYLCSILEPTHGLITTIGREHLEFFKTMNGVADEEGALFDNLRTRTGGVAIVNADDPRIRAKARRVKRKIRYGFGGKSLAVRGKMSRMDAKGCSSFRLSSRGSSKGSDVRMKVPGAHNAANALAAAAVGIVFKVSPAKIRKALEGFRPVSKRMEVVHVGQVTIFNDTYNANPDSVIAAVQTLASAQVSGKKIAVLADMREMGAQEVEEHRRVGAEIGKIGVDYLLTYGPLGKHIHDAAKVQFAIHYNQKNMLAEYLAELVSPGDAVLVKGSRAMAMEDVVTFLQERLRTPGGRGK